MVDSARPKCVYLCLPALMLVLLGSLLVPASALAHDSHSNAALSGLDIPSPAPIDVLFDDPIPVKDLYLAVSKAFGLQVVFDPGLKPRDLSLRMEDVTAHQVLGALRLGANHLHRLVDERTLYVADDTPQNRRSLEAEGLRSFFLSDLQTKDAMTLLRSLVGVKHLAVDDERNAIVVRDTFDRLRVAESLLEKHDRPQPEVSLAFELIEVTTGARAKPLPSRVKSAELEALLGRYRGRVLASPRLVAHQGAQAELQARDELPRGSAGAGRLANFTIEATPRVHLESREVTVSLGLQLRYLAAAAEPRAEGAPDRTLERHRSLKSSLRVADGETALLSGLLDTGAEPGDGRQLVLAVTPQVRHFRGLSESDRATIRFDTGIGLATEPSSAHHQARLDKVRKQLQERLRETKGVPARGPQPEAESRTGDRAQLR